MVLWNEAFSRKNVDSDRCAVVPAAVTPKPAVDEWGFGGRGAQRFSRLPLLSAPMGAQRQTAALAAHAAAPAVRKALQDYLFSLGLFFSQLARPRHCVFFIGKGGTVETLPSSALTTDQRELVEKCATRRRLLFDQLS